MSDGNRCVLAIVARNPVVRTCGDPRGHKIHQMWNDVQF